MTCDRCLSSLFFICISLSISSCNKDIPDTRSGWDIPENEGVYNTLQNADQLINITYLLAADIKAVGMTYNANSSVSGLLYSSTRDEDLFCPNNVSWWTFLSALKNPQSYIYTIDISEPPYLIRGLAKPYYGQVCTSFVQYALGIKYNFQIHQMTTWDGFDRIKHQKVDSLKLGDVLTTEEGHTRIVTGIYRNMGKVESVIISEGVPPVAKKETYSHKEVESTLKNDGYNIYRYRYISHTSKSTNPLVYSLVQNEFNEFLCPRRGDKANWRKDEPIIIDILKNNGFDRYQLYKDGSLLDICCIEETDTVIDLGILPSGHYELNLSNESGHSPSVFFIVADYDISAEPLGGGKVKVSYTSANARPIWITWRRPAYIDSDNNNMPLWTEVINPEDVLNGYRYTELDDYTKKVCGLGEWDFKVAFETEYGIISSDSVNINVK